MRTRTHGYWQTEEHDYITTNPAPTEPIQWPVLHSWEHMADWVPRLAHEQTFVRQRHMHRVNPCSHEKWVYEGGYTPDWLGDYGYSHSQPGVFPAIDGQSIVSILPSVAPNDLQDAHLDAFNALNEQFPEQLSGAEFVSGFAELKSLIPKLSGDVLRDLATLHLNSEFGWSPLIEDLQTLSRVVSNSRKRLEWLKKTFGKPTKLRFKRGIAIPSIGNSVIWTPRRGWGFRYVHVKSQAVYHAGATLHQYMTHLDDAIGLMRALTVAFGLDNPVKALWEVLPFSFVVDWFLNVSTRLDGLSKFHPSEPWDLTQLTWSLKTIHVVRVDRVVRDLISWSDQDYNAVGHVIVTYYDRQLEVPTDWGQYYSPQLSPSQLGLLMALGLVHNR